MGSHRNALVAVVRQELAEARGTARAVLAAAESARNEALRRKQLIRDAYSTCLAQLAEARESRPAGHPAADERRGDRADPQRRVAGRDHRRRGRRDGLALLDARPNPTGSPGRGCCGSARSAYDAGDGERRLPALVPLLDHAHVNLTGDQPAVDGVISGLLLRALGTTRPGEVRLSVYDPEQLGGTLAAFAPLGNAGLLSFVGPGGLGALLDDLVEQICRVNESVLAGEYTSLAELTAATTGPRPEPWRIVVLLRRTPSSPPASAPSWTGSPGPGWRAAYTWSSGAWSWRRIPTVEHIAVQDEHRDLRHHRRPAGPPRRRAPGRPDRRLLPDDRRTAARRARRRSASPTWNRRSSGSSRPRTGSSAPIGDSTDGSLISVPLGDDPPHALIGGPSGSGKTNLIYAWIGSLAARYGPEELAFYLLDFKEGVSFARFAPGPRDPSWLPQVRLAGINVNGDREFGLAMLRHLGEELRARAQAAKRYEASKLAELRAEDPRGHWPRIVAVIDEFQVLLAGRDAVADEAVALLEDLARRGRSQGIHLVLASQDVSGIEALWGRSGLIGQFTLRIALPKARRILADTNLAAAVIPRFHAVVNADSGVDGANHVVRLPDAGRPDGLAHAAAQALARAAGQLPAAAALRR